MALTDNNYIGLVVYNQDPDYSGRCKVRVFGLMDDLSDDLLPWFTPINSCVFSGSGNGYLSIPKIGTYVRVRFANGDIYSGEYTAIQNIDPRLINEIKDNYQNSHVMCYDGDTDFYMMFQPSKMTNGIQDGKGFKIYYNDAVIQITPDGRIYCQTMDGESIIEMNGEDVKIYGGNDVTVSGATTVNVIGSTINIKGNEINIGNNATEPMVLGNNLANVLKVLCNEIAAKNPQTPGSPNPDMIDSILSNTIKVAK